MSKNELLQKGLLIKSGSIELHGEFSQAHTKLQHNSGCLFDHKKAQTPQILLYSSGRQRLI